MALKRHETPVPAFFDAFSSQVRERIERELAAEALRNNKSWWRSALAQSRGWLASIGVSWATRMGSWTRNPIQLGANAVIVVGISLLGVSAFHHVNRSDQDELYPDQPTLYPAESLRTAGPGFTTGSPLSQVVTSASSTQKPPGGPMLLRIEIQPIDLDEWQNATYSTFPTSSSLTQETFQSPMTEASLWKVSLDQ